jgi:hypothetical protein
LEERVEEHVREAPGAEAERRDAEDEAHAAELESALLAASPPDNKADANTNPAETNSTSAVAVEAEV